MIQPRVTLSYSFQRKDTTGVLCQEAMYDVLGRDHVAWVDPVRFDSLLDPPASDLLLAIDDDGEWRFPDDWPGVKAVWLIDTHLNFEKRLRRVKDRFDFVFCAQRDGAAMMRENGVPNAYWLPLACLPSLHHPHEVKLQYDWCFVGNVVRSEWLPPDRADCLDRMKEAFPCYYAGNAYREEMMVRYCQSRMIFNRSIKSDVNMRVFEAIASNRPLFTDYLPDLELLFPDDCMFFYTDESMVTQFRDYCSNGDLRGKVRSTGFTMVNRWHTYQRRLRRILEICVGYKADQHWPYPEQS